MGEHICAELVLFVAVFLAAIASAVWLPGIVEAFSHWRSKLKARKAPVGSLWKVHTTTSDFATEILGLDPLAPHRCRIPQGSIVVVVAHDYNGTGYITMKQPLNNEEVEVRTQTFFRNAVRLPDQESHHEPRD